MGISCSQAFRRKREIPADLCHITSVAVMHRLADRPLSQISADICHITLIAWYVPSHSCAAAQVSRRLEQLGDPHPSSAELERVRRELEACRHELASMHTKLKEAETAKQSEENSSPMDGRVSQIHHIVCESDIVRERTAVLCCAKDGVVSQV